jgi:hypothetical protein
MQEQPSGPEGTLQVQQIRVYYDPESGDIVHVHQLVAMADETLDERRIDDEMTAFEQSLRERHATALEYLIVDEALLQEAISPEVNLKVDVSARRLIRDQPANSQD